MSHSPKYIIVKLYFILKFDHSQASTLLSCLFMSNTHILDFIFNLFGTQMNVTILRCPIPTKRFLCFLGWHIIKPTFHTIAKPLKF